MVKNNYKEYWKSHARIGDSPEGNPQDILNEIIGSVIDIGCGNGRWSQYFDDYLGIDLNKDNIDYCKKKYKNKEFVHADIIDWKPNKKFDTAFTYLSLGHIPTKYMNKLASKIKSLATTIVMVENTDMPSNGLHCFTHNYNSYFDIIKNKKYNDFHLMVAKGGRNG